VIRRRSLIARVSAHSMDLVAQSRAPPADFWLAISVAELPSSGLLTTGAQIS
jgi:hypothetical protein